MLSSHSSERVLLGLFSTLAVLFLNAGSSAQQTPTRSLVTKTEYERWATELSNWGRWGKDDEIGALNLITPAKRRAAAALVKRGLSVSMAADANEVRDATVNPTPYEREVTSTGPAYAMDRIGVAYHGGAHTHIDALSHRLFDGKMYNGFSGSTFTREGGAARDSIYSAHAGIVTRGVLMDIPALKGVPYLEPGTRIFAEDLEAWERKAGVRVAAGDAVFIRTGRWVRSARTGAATTSDTSGLDASVIPWLKRRDISLIGSEFALDARPSADGLGLAVHDFALAYLGVHVIDNCNLTTLAEVAGSERRWEFQFVAAPLPIKAGTGSPVNPIAVY